MFDIGFSEIFVIAVVALLVLGPERLPKAARFAGLWVRRARAQWYSVKAELENELADEELKRSLRQAQEQLRAAEAALREQTASVEQGVRGVARDVEAAVRDHPDGPTNTSTERPPSGPDEAIALAGPWMDRAPATSDPLDLGAGVDADGSQNAAEQSAPAPPARRDPQA